MLYIICCILPETRFWQNSLINVSEKNEYAAWLLAAQCYEPKQSCKKRAFGNETRKTYFFPFFVSFSFFSSFFSFFAFSLFSVPSSFAFCFLCFFGRSFACFGFFSFIFMPIFLNSSTTSSWEAFFLMSIFVLVGSMCFTLTFFLLVSPSISTKESSIMPVTTHFFPASLPAIFMQTLPVSIIFP